MRNCLDRACIYDIAVKNYMQYDKISLYPWCGFGKFAI